MDNKILIAIVVVVIAVIGIGAFVLLGNGGSTEKDTYDINTDCRIFGNANNDNYLDEKDAKLIQDMIDNKITWDLKKHPLADANCDGTVDKKDVDLVNDFIAGKSATMYYVDWDNKKASVNYPLGDVLEGGKYSIHSMFSTGLDMEIILGIYDYNKYMSNGDISAADLDQEMYPGSADMETFDIKLTADHYETFVKKGIKITFGDKRWYDDGFLTAAEKNFGQYNLNVIKLPQNRVVNDITWHQTMIALGVMFNAQDSTADYIAYYEKVQKAVSDAVKKSGATTKTFAMPYTAPGDDYTSISPMWLDGRGSSNTVMADVKTIEMLPLESAFSVKAFDGFDAVETETIVSYNPDVVIVSAFGYASAGDKTVEDQEKRFNEFAEVFKKANYKGKLYGISFENCVMAGPAFILTLANMIWGDDAFDEETAWEYMYEYYDNFTNWEGTLEDLKESKFAVWEYTA